MYLKLRIVFTILSAVCIAAVFPMGFLFDWPYAIAAALVALLFFGLMLLCKQSQENQENPHGFSDLSNDTTSDTADGEMDSEMDGTENADKNDKADGDCKESDKNA